jgi:hypothetical protein
MGKTFKTIDDAVIRFAGDSGDGMQLTGGRFTETTAVVGNDLSTLPDFPAEIRAPAGSLAGVLKSFPTTAVVSVNLPPVNCIPSPESPAKRITASSIVLNVFPIVPTIY